MEPILQMLHSKVIPWASKDAGQRLVVARPQINMEDLPRGVTLSRRKKITGRRVIIKKRREHANQRKFIAEWPDDNLQEIALPRIACVVNGTADYLLENYCLHCNESTFILIPARTPHHRRGPFLDPLRPPDASCTLLFAQAYSHGIELWFSQSDGKHHFYNFINSYLIHNVAAVGLFKTVVEEAVTALKGYEIICTNLLHTIFFMLAREVETGHFSHPGPKRDSHLPAPSPHNFHGELNEYIEANFNRPVKLAEAAAAMYLSPPQFCRRVRQETGLTFIELLTRYRIERAQALLRETDWTAAAISSHVGFQSPAYFQNVFRRRVGCTPVEYRQKR